MPIFFRFAMLAIMIFMSACSSADTGSDTNTNLNANPGNPVSEAVTPDLASPQGPDSANAEPSTPDPANAGLVARVNGDAISQDDVSEALERLQIDSNAADISMLREQVIQALIQQKLIEQAAPGLGIVISDEDVQSEIDSLKAAVNDDAMWQEFLQLNGYTEEEMLAAQRESLLTQRVRDELGLRIEGAVRQVNARHILVRTEAEAVAVLDRLSNGEDFAQVAAEVSIDLTTREQGGDLGWFTADELTDRRLGEVTFSLLPDQIAGPVATSIGFHIIQALAFEERLIEPERMPMLMENLFNNWIQQRLSEAAIERYN